jgi:multidrug efflux pump
VDKEMISGMGITIREVASTISAFHRDAPIGNFAVGNKNYDFRLQGKMRDPREILDIPLILPQGRTIKVGDIAKIERYYDDQSIDRIGFAQTNAQDAVTLTVIKNDGSGIFGASKQAKELISTALKDPKYAGISVAYANDQADIIGDDYAELTNEAIITLVLVFIIMWLFIGFRDSLFATISLPLAFLVTFMFLDALGLSLNFLTNFSLILSFGIAIDTIVVIVQAASAKVRVGYEPRSAIMLALREYGIPIISGVMTTIVAFVPMMVLPGILGKFLAYIPITLFGVLAFGLILALTVNSALYLLFVKSRKTYVHDDTAIEYADA